MSLRKKYGFQTIAAHSHLDGKKQHRSLVPPIYQGVNFQAANSQQLGELFQNQSPQFYTRFGNPTLAAVGEKIAQLEEAEAGLVFSSGMGAITTSLLGVLRASDHVVAQRNIFAQTFLFLDRMARGYGVETTFVDATRPEQIAGAMQANTRLVYIETPSNPQLKVVDIAAVAEIAHRQDCLLFVDSTFATPLVQKPLRLGASLVLHSATKYLAGHSDLLCGAAAGSGDLVQKIRDAQVVLGNMLDPHAAWALLRGIKTLGLRVARQSANAQRIAEFLEGQLGIRCVHYPGLESDPGYPIARRQMQTGGGMVSFEVEGGLDAARAFVDTLELIPLASSLGGVETLIEIPSELDFGEKELGEAAKESGIESALIRLSAGTEEIEDLLADLEKGLLGLRHHVGLQSAAVAT